jgi:hypothetical protein
MYLEVDEGFLEHPKTLRLCSLMSNPLAFGYLMHLWRWACRCCESGDLRGIGPYEIEEAARYHQHDGKLFAAMVSAGFVDVDNDGAPVQIHNWTSRTGAAIKRMKAEADRKKQYRAHKEGKCKRGCQWCKTVRGQSAGHPEDIPRTSSDESDTDQTSPDKTSPVQTRPDKTRQEDPEISDCPETAQPSLVPAEPAILSYPCDGKPGAWALTQTQLSQWAALYPSLDLLGESRKALSWIQALPARRKTAGGMARFLVGWFGRAQNRGGQSRSPPIGQRPLNIGHMPASTEHPTRTGRLEIP